MNIRNTLGILLLLIIISTPAMGIVDKNKTIDLLSKKIILPSVI